MGFCPDFLFCVQKVAQAGQDPAVAQGLDEFRAFFYVDLEIAPCSFFHNLLVDRPAIFQEMPDIVDIPVRRFGAFQDSHKLVSEHVLPGHHQHGDPEIIFQLIAWSEKPSIDLDLDVSCIFLIWKNEQQGVGFYVFFLDRAVFPEDVFEPAENSSVSFQIKERSREVKTVFFDRSREDMWPFSMFMNLSYP